ncbi:MAG: DUF4389 domain-containing protein [Candidatus Stahlbacteria bacterium]|nr:MAG: DUF4389 domain-containing protein [Candidatus Stahlbacteria bacterium]
MDHPLHYKIDYPEKLSRGILILRLFFGWLYCSIPHFFLLFFVGIAAAFVSFIAWWAILFTGKYPKWAFNFVLFYWRWQLRVLAYLYYMTDVYPPFTGKEIEGHPVHFSIDYPERLSRGLLFLRLFLGWAYIWIPHYLILWPLLMAVSFIVGASWWVILFTGRYPRNMFNLIVGVYRWYLRVMAYYGFMTDRYPPFTDEE